MIRRTSTCVMALVAAFWVVGAFGAETVESVEKKIVQQVAKCKSYQIASRVTSDSSCGDTSVVTTDEIRCETLSKGDRTLWRMEVQSKRVTKAGKAPPQTEEGSRLVIYDGTYVSTLTQAQGEKFATRSAPGRQDESPFDMKASLDEIGKQCTLKVLSEAAVEGRDCYVIEAVRGKGAAAGAFARVVTYYDKKAGLPLKSISYDAAGKAVQTMIVTDMKANIEIPAERFVFKTPVGVVVLDMTKVSKPTTQPGPADISPELPDE